MLAMWILIRRHGERLKGFSSELTYQICLLEGSLWMLYKDWTGERQEWQRTQSGGITAIKVREDGGLDQGDSNEGDECISQQDLTLGFRM